MHRFLLSSLFAATLALAGCGGHYHGPEVAYEGTFNASTELGGDTQVRLRLYDNGTYITRTVYTGRSAVPVVETGTWALEDEALVLTTERVDGEPTPSATTVFARNADDLEAVAINGSPLDFVWAYAEGDKLSEGLEPPAAHGDGYGDESDHGGYDAEGDESYEDGDEAPPTDAVEEAAPAEDADAANA